MRACRAHTYRNFSLEQRIVILKMLAHFDGPFSNGIYADTLQRLKDRYGSYIACGETQKEQRYDRYTFFFVETKLKISGNGNPGLAIVFPRGSRLDAPLVVDMLKKME